MCRPRACTHTADCRGTYTSPRSTKADSVIDRTAPHPGPEPIPRSVKSRSLPLFLNHSMASPIFSTSIHSPLPLPPLAPCSLPLPPSTSWAVASGKGSGANLTFRASHCQLFTSLSHSTRSSRPPIAYMIPGCPVFAKPTSESCDERVWRSLRLLGASR
jgi:hypothetical protein